jgi:ATP phosphoribosyltransferase regulatory subunit
VFPVESLRNLWGIRVIIRGSGVVSLPGSDLLKTTALRSRAVLTIGRIINRAGFNEIDVPLLAPLDEFLHLGDEWLMKSAYKVIDQSGQVALLRPDFTTMVYKLALTELSHRPRPLKVWYSGEIFRRTKNPWEMQSAYQVGVEVFGVKEISAEVDCLEIVWQALRALGLSDFRINIGHAGLFRAWCDSFDKNGSMGQRMREALANRDLVAAEEACKSLPGPKRDMLFRLMRLRGGCEVLAEAKQVSTKSRDCQVDIDRCLNDLNEILISLQAKNILENVTLDLGLLRNLNYYSGMVFEAHVPGIGVPVVGGGRYDGIFGSESDESAVGFALSLDSLMTFLQSAGTSRIRDGMKGLGRSDGSSTFASSCHGRICQPYPISGIH